MKNARVIFDTSFLLDMLRYKVDISLLYERLGKFEKLVLDSTLNELNTIARKSSKKGMLARVALQLIRNEDFRTIKTGEKDFDKAILKIKNNYYVATNDLALRKKLKEKGIKTIYLRAKKKIEVE